MVLVVNYLGPYGLYVAYGDNYEVLKYFKLCNLYEFILTDVDKRTNRNHSPASKICLPNTRLLLD